MALFLCAVQCIFVAYLHITCGFPGGSDGKESACNAGDPGLILEKGMAAHFSVLA